MIFLIRGEIGIMCVPQTEAHAVGEHLAPWIDSRVVALL